MSTLRASSAVNSKPVRTPRSVPARSAGLARWSRGDALLAAGLVLLTALSRWPFRTTMLSWWDAGLFAQALDDYNVVVHHPQPPGYVLYVAVAKLIHAVTGLGANQTYTLISIAAASLTVAMLYLLGTLMFGRLTGLLAAGLALTSPSFWFYSEITYPYTTLALGSTVLGLLSWLLWQRRIAHPWWTALVFALLGGLRPDLLLFLAPLFAASFIVGVGVRSRRARAQFGLAGVAGLAGIAVWWTATDLASEGWGSLWHALTAQATDVTRSTSVFAIGFNGLRANAHLLAWFSREALYLAVLPALAYVLQWPTRPRRESWRPPFLLLWMTPAIGFYLLVHIGDAGYVFSFLPPVLLAAAAGLTRAATAIAEKLPRRLCRGGTRRAQWVVAAGLAALILPYHSWLFVGSDRLFSAGRLGCHDRALAAAVATIAADFPPAATQIATSGYLPHVAVYLPEYRRVQFLHPDRDTTWQAPAGIDRVLVFDFEMGVDPADRDRGWSWLPLGCEGYDLAVTRAAGTTFTFDARRFELRATR